jgi:hypothetical protein
MQKRPPNTRHEHSNSIVVKLSCKTIDEDTMPKIGTNNAKGATIFGEYSRNNRPHKAKAKTVEIRAVYRIAPAPAHEIFNIASTWFFSNSHENRNNGIGGIILIQMINRNISMFPQSFIKMFETAQAKPEATTSIRPIKLVVSYLSIARNPIPKKAIIIPVCCHRVGLSRKIRLDSRRVNTA